MTDPSPKARLRPVIRVFVSSTFSDMRLERNALQEYVYPKLEQLCVQNGFQFQAIDLRWGVSGEAGLDHRTMRICFEELRRSQEVSPEPNFLVLLGNRYGWRPLPEEISQAEFEKLVAAVKAGGENQPLIQGTHGKTAKQVLREWYRCDENVLPPIPTETAPDSAPLNYILQPRTQGIGDGRDYTHTKDEPPRDTQDWIDVQHVLWRIINVAFPAGLLDQRFDHIDWPQHIADVYDRQHPKRAIPQIVRFQGSATEQEIWCGALSAANAERHVLAFFRDIANRDNFAPTDVKDFFDLTETGTFDETSATMQTALKEAIGRRLGKGAPVPIPFTRLKRENGKVVVDASPKDIRKFCVSVETQLRSIIERQIEQYWHKTKQASAERALRELEIEQQEHARVSQERGDSETFVGRKDELEVIREYLYSEATWPLVIHGASGCGKTALMARAAQEAKALKPVVRLIGIHPRSSDLRGLLSSLCQELRLRHPCEGALPTDIKVLEAELHEHFRAATPKQPLILFLDALDQLADADGGRLLHWIPVGPLPVHVKLVVSCLSDRADGDPAGQPYAELRQRPLPAENFINLVVFSEEEAMTLLFDRWQPQVGRKVSRDQRARIKKRLVSAACRQPIYLKLLFEEARLWRSYDAIPNLGEGVPALLDQLFKRLGRPANHGPLLVERVLGYLAASREGLAENEILEILFRDPDYKKALDQATKDTRHEMPPNATRIPIAIWSRLHFDLASYLTERAATGANVLTFYHRQVAEWVQKHFEKAPGQSWQPHQRLANYFRRVADPGRYGTWRCRMQRPYVELPYHLERAGQRLRSLWFDTLGDLRFAEAKCEVQLVYDLLANLDAAVRESAESAHRERLFQLRSAVRSQAAGLNLVPSLSGQQLALRVLDYVSPDGELAGRARLFFERESGEKPALAYPFLPEHARPSAEQMELSGLPHVRAVVPYHDHAIAFCEGRRWYECDDNGAIVREGATTQDCHAAAGGGGRIATAVGKYGFVWDEWPSERPHAQVVATDDISLLAMSGTGDSLLIATRDGRWFVLSRGAGGRWSPSGRSQAEAGALAAVVIGGGQWAVATADSRLHLGSGAQWNVVALPCRGLTAACFDDAGAWVAVSCEGKVVAFDLAGRVVYELPDRAKGLKVVRSLPGNGVLATTEDGAICRFALGGAEDPVALITSERGFQTTTLFENGHRAIATDYLGEARLFSVQLAPPELAVRELPVGEAIRAARLDETGLEIQGVDSTGARFALAYSVDRWSARVLEPLPMAVDQAWFRDAGTLITTEDFNAASSLYEHRLGAPATIRTRRVWPADDFSEVYRSFGNGALSPGGSTFAISTRRVELGGHEVLLFDARGWHILFRTAFDEDHSVRRVVPDDSGQRILINHDNRSQQLTMVRHGHVDALPIAGGVRRSEANWSPPIGDLDLSADGSRFMAIESDGTAYLVLTDSPAVNDRVTLGRGVKWCRLVASGDMALLGRGDREVEAVRVSPQGSVMPLCRFFAPFRIEWAGLFAAQGVVLAAGKGAIWGCRFHTDERTGGDDARLGGVQPERDVRGRR